MAYKDAVRNPNSKPKKRNGVILIGVNIPLPNNEVLVWADAYTKVIAKD